MRKRSKYRPKPVDCYVTQGLFDELGRDMHFALMALDAGMASETSWKKVGKVLVIVHLASVGDSRLVGSDDHRFLTSAILTLDAMQRGAERTGEWRLYGLDLASVTNGVVAAERMLPLLKANKLGDAYRKALVIGAQSLAAMAA